MGRWRRRLLVVWSDAMFAYRSAEYDVAASLAGLGFVVREPATHRTWFAGRRCDQRILDSFTFRKTHVGQLELLAELVPYLTLPHILAGCDVFVDNTSAIFSVLN